MFCDTALNILPLERILALVLHVAPFQHGRKRESWKPPPHVPQPSLLARHDNAVRPSFFFLDPVRERHLFYYQQRKRSPPSPKTCLFMEMVEGWGENRAEETQKRKFWQDLIYCLQREMCNQRQESELCGPEQNMWCFKEFDLQLKLLPWFPEVFLSYRGKLKELVSRFKTRLDVFPACLCRSQEGMMSIIVLPYKIQKYYIIVWEFLRTTTARCPWFAAKRIMNWNCDWTNQVYHPE